MEERSERQEGREREAPSVVQQSTAATARH
jgi:hypothetical protein